MRTWGRNYNTGEWVEVTTDENGLNDAVWMTTLAQVLLLNRGESPFYGDYGIPAQQAVITDLPPDFYVTLTAQQFSPFFASLIVNRRPNTGTGPNNPPVYDFNGITNMGAIFNETVVGTFPI
jgi:hypothetical protein